MQSFFIILIRVLAICLMICIGAVARKRGILSSQATYSLSMLSTNLIYPAAIFSSLVGGFTVKSILGNWMLPAGTFTIMLIGFVIGGICKFFLKGCTPEEKRMFHFQSTVNNYIFLPLPLIMQEYGDQGVGLLSLSTIGSELAVWTIGMCAMSGGFKLDKLKNLLNMPMIAVMISICVIIIKEYMPWHPQENGFCMEVWNTLLSSTKQFGAGTVALSMIVAGSRMTELDFSKIFSKLQYFIAFLRLVFIPAICIALLYVLPVPVSSRNILAIIAVMPTAVASVSFSDVFKADTQTAAASVLLTHAVGLITIAIWMSILL